MHIYPTGTRLIFWGLVRRGKRDIGVFTCSGNHKPVGTRRFYIDVCSVSQSLTWGCAECMKFYRPKYDAQDVKRSLQNQHYWMMDRCYSEDAPNYASYGGRGVTVHEPWHDFEAYSTYVRVLPYFGVPEYTLDRIDNDRGYEPGNVRWAPEWWQQVNKRENQHLLMYKPYYGEVLPIEFQ